MEINVTPKVLVVDDRRENLLAMKKLLAPLNTEVITVDSGEQALSEVLNHQFAVILLDVQMPGMDGFETAQLMRSNQQTETIPIIFVTAINKEERYVAKGYEAGAVDYMPKPIVPEILLSKVRVFLQLEEQRLALEEVSRQLRASNQKNKLLLECAAEGIVGLDAQGLITFTNPTANQLLGADEAELLQHSISEFFFSGADAQQQWQASPMYVNCLQQGESVTDTVQLYNRHQGEFPAELNMAAILGKRDQVEGAVVVFQDITERKRLENELVRMAKYDNLTGLATRALFMEFLQNALDRSDRNKKQAAVMFLDLDHFKEINDTLGHEAGDQLLVSVAERLTSCIRKVDLVARLGGDEFAVVLDSINNAEDANLVAQKILHALTSPHQLTAGERVVGTSIGIALYPNDETNPDALIKAADQAMYVAKEQGRNDVRFYGG